MDACAHGKRQFIPTVDEYFEEAIMHSDPANEIEVLLPRSKIVEKAFLGSVQVLLGSFIRLAFAPTFGSFESTILLPATNNNAPFTGAKVLGAYFQAITKGEKRRRG